MTSRGVVRTGVVVALFIVAATLNSGGYRYGASDQAFYIPAILDALHPALFPRDGALIAPQARYFFVDEAVAAGMRTLGGSIEAWFLAGYLLALATLAIALAALGRTVFASPWAVAAFLIVGTLKHRITKTGVNTLEGYFHPRVLVFAVGVGALALFLRGRPWLALGLVAMAGLVHPTTAAFFLLLLGVAAWTTMPHTRRPLAALGLAGIVLAGWMVTAGPWQDALTPMDAAWRTLLSSKDYLFPIDVWSASTWLVNMGTAILAIGGLALRRHAGAGVAGERGLLAGAAALLALFLVSLPAVHAGVALAVQLQISRVFWLLELLAWIPVLWWLVDRPMSGGAASRRRAVAVVSILAAFSAGRALYVGFIERDRVVFQYSLPASDWTDAMRWIETHTPIDAHILSDPGHAFRYGFPVRFIGRDVYVEEVKDTAMALYDRSAATRVITRLRDLGDFTSLTPERVRRLSADYDIGYVVTPYAMDLPERAVFGRFHVYEIGE